MDTGPLIDRCNPPQILPTTRGPVENSVCHDHHPERVIDCRPRHGPRPAAGICWEDLTEEKIAAIPLLSAQRAGQQ
jgi:hypothetical protein